MSYVLYISSILSNLLVSCVLVVMLQGFVYHHGNYVVDRIVAGALELVEYFDLVQRQAKEIWGGASMACGVGNKQEE